MKFTCQRLDLLRAVQQVAPAVAARTTKPILSQIKAVAEDDRLTLTAQDVELGIRSELRGVQVREGGAAILANPQLPSILKESDDSEVTIEANDDGATIHIGASRFSTPGYPVAEYPDLPEMDGGADYHEVLAGDIRTLIRRTVFAADKKDSTRFALAGILWELDPAGTTVRLIATDSKRLAVCEKPATAHGAVANKGSHLIPAKTLKLLESNLTDDGERVRVVLRPNEAMFQTERAMIYTRLIEGRYPPYREIISQTKKQCDKTIVLPAAALLQKVRQAAIMANDESKRLDLVFSSGKLVLSAKGAELGSSEVTMSLPDYDGLGKVAISFDPQYLAEFLNVVKGEDDGVNVTLEMSTGDKPALFQIDGTFRYLVMPLAG